ncbi:3-dehydroquinate synthase [Virgibacillus doumboii]|uniref:3-dehydroquinate synthase n=1 Tax=Virgibacillus doumboii TaxID=2697503 RepID=UPI0013DF238B|nr:3-dehydroquinate synthase [Virgibacillus doumboii]
MKVTKVVSSSNIYNVYVGEKLRNELEQFLPKKYTSVFIVTDEIVANYYLEDVKSSLSNSNVISSVIPHGEKTKNIDTFYQLHTDALQYGLDRESLIIALGGGVVGDVAGFVAATYMRGIDFIQMPTTILAHDSSVGGKVAINHEQGKNMIGNFYSPSAVVFDVETLQTLDKKEIRSGYAELVKEALLADADFFNSILDSDLSTLTMLAMSDHINKGIAIKATIVESDEKEAGIRKYLNLGHTMGHALEALLGYGDRTHGEAVAIGLLFAMHVSEQYFKVKLPYKQLSKWLKDNNYPIELPAINTHHILNKMKLDKKTVDTNIQMILLSKIAKPEIVEVNDADLLIYLDSFINRLAN